MPLEVPAMISNTITPAVLAGVAFLAGYIILQLTRVNHPSRVKAYATVGFLGAFFCFGWFFGWGIYVDFLLGLRTKGLAESFMSALNSGNLIYMIGCIPTVILFFSVARGKPLAVPQSQVQVTKASRQITENHATVKDALSPPEGVPPAQSQDVKPAQEEKKTVETHAPTSIVSPPPSGIDLFLKDLELVMLDVNQGGKPLLVYASKAVVEKCMAKGTENTPATETEPEEEPKGAEDVQTQPAVETPVEKATMPIAEKATPATEKETQRKGPPESKYCRHC
jgi:hypothetical protein